MTLTPIKMRVQMSYVAGNITTGPGSSATPQLFYLTFWVPAGTTASKDSAARLLADDQCRNMRVAPQTCTIVLVEELP